MHTLTALFDAPMPAATALRALAAAGLAPADLGLVAARPLSDAAHGGDFAAEIALRAERFVDVDARAALAGALAEALPERGVPMARAAGLADRVAAGEAWLVGAACPDALAAQARRALWAAAAVEVFAA
ncbi:MAG: hypothetical protein ABI780_14380 [Ardenticatenales bacterium]